MVRAIDLQTTISQISSAEKVQQIQQQHADMQQRHFQLELQKQDRLAKDQVKHSEEADRAKIREKEEQENKRKRESKQEKNQTRLLEIFDEEESEEGGIINITV
ncbi:MAG: hypothetical protein R6W75_07275 [Smithellaceae bacterium]